MPPTRNKSPYDLEARYGTGPGESKRGRKELWADGVSSDISVFLYHFENLKEEYIDGTFGKSLLQELEDRGYDLTTLKFSIKRKPLANIGRSMVQIVAHLQAQERARVQAQERTDYEKWKAAQKSESSKTDGSTNPEASNAPDPRDSPKSS